MLQNEKALKFHRKDVENISVFKELKLDVHYFSFLTKLKNGAIKKLKFRKLYFQKSISVFALIFSSLIFSFSQAQQMFFHLLPGFVPAYTWVGLGGNANWNTAANWSTGVVPGAGNTAIFNDICVSNCDPTMNIVINVGGINIEGTYGGTITQAAGQTITIGVSGWTQAAGTFTGGNSAVTINGVFTLSGGVYTATSGTWTQSANMTVTGSPTLNHNSGSWITGNDITISPNGITLNNVTFGGYIGIQNLNAGTMIVNGTLSMADTANGSAVNNGTIEARGDIPLFQGSCRVS